jgi:hypothetical protein
MTTWGQPRSAQQELRGQSLHSERHERAPWRMAAMHNYASVNRSSGRTRDSAVAANKASVLSHPNRGMSREGEAFTVSSHRDEAAAPLTR